MPIAAILVIFAVGAVALFRVANDPGASLLDIAPFLAAMLYLPIAVVKDLFRTEPS